MWGWENTIPSASLCWTACKTFWQQCHQNQPHGGRAKVTARITGKASSKKTHKGCWRASSTSSWNWMQGTPEQLEPLQAPEFTLFLPAPSCHFTFVWAFPSQRILLSSLNYCSSLIINDASWRQGAELRVQFQRQGDNLLQPNAN